MIVVSMGTGTSLVKCEGDDIRHIGGVGVGGGTLMGLSRIMLQTDDIKQVVALAEHGDISNIDVQIGDISPRPLPGLPREATASLFGNAKSNASREDIALGILTTVLQTIGSSCILARVGHQGVCAHWQSHAFASMPTNFSCHGKTLWCEVHHTKI